jgi:hypothetical protein
MTIEKNFVTAEECQVLAEQMNRKYQYALEGRSFKIAATTEKDAVFVTVTLANVDESFVYPVDARVHYKSEDLTARRAALFLIDYIDVYFEEFLQEDGELYLPIDWAEHEYDTVKFQIKGQIHNMKLEKWADQLLGEQNAPNDGELLS